MCSEKIREIPSWVVALDQEYSGLPKIFPKICLPRMLAVNLLSGVEIVWPIRIYSRDPLTNGQPNAKMVQVVVPKRISKIPLGPRTDLDFSNPENGPSSQIPWPIWFKVTVFLRNWNGSFFLGKKNAFCP